MLSFSIANILKDTGVACRNMPSEMDKIPGEELRSECEGTNSAVSSFQGMQEHPTRAPVCSTPDPEGATIRDLQNRSVSPVSCLLSSDTSYSFEDGDQKAPGPQRRKKSRTTFTMEQINDLERTYHSQRYLPANERREMAKRLRLSDQQVKTWFQNRRMKEKRQIKDTDDVYKHAHAHVPAHPHLGYHLGGPHPATISLAGGLPLTARPATTAYSMAAVTTFPPIPPIQRHPMVSMPPGGAPTLSSSSYLPVNSHLMAYAPGYLAQY